MPVREASSGSLGTQASSGSALAKQTTCSPGPDRISSTMPFFGRTRVSTSRIGTRLRAADGENCRASSTATGRQRWSVSVMSICFLTQLCASGPRLTKAKFWCRESADPRVANLICDQASRESDAVRMSCMPSPACTGLRGDSQIREGGGGGHSAHHSRRWNR